MTDSDACRSADTRPRAIKVFHAERVRRWLAPSAAIIVLLLLLAWMAGLFDNRMPPGLATPTASTAEGAVAAERVERTLFEVVSASVEARQATLISARIMAKITAIHVRAGDLVTTGQLLLALEQSDLQARAAQSREQIRAIGARLHEAKRNLARVRTLHGKGLVAAADLDRAQANSDSLRAELAGARRALEEAETALAYSELRAPIDGRVVDRFAEPGDTATPGSKLLSLYNPLSLRIEARVREKLALQLAVDQALQVEVPALERHLDAYVEELVPAAEPGSRSFLVKARVDYDDKLLPGMYARLLIPAGTAARVLIPADRVVQVGQLNLIWVLVDGRAQRRFIRLGAHAPPERVEVFAGLSAGEQVLPVPEE